MVFPIGKYQNSVLLCSLFGQCYKLMFSPPIFFFCQVSLVQWTESVGLTLVGRDQSSMQLRTPSGQILNFTILQIFPFTYESKRMGIIVRVRPGTMWPGGIYFILLHYIIIAGDTNSVSTGFIQLYYQCKLIVLVVGVSCIINVNKLCFGDGVIQLYHLIINRSNNIPMNHMTAWGLGFILFIINRSNLIDSLIDPSSGGSVHRKYFAIVSYLNK